MNLLDVVFQDHPGLALLLPGGTSASVRRSRPLPQQHIQPVQRSYVAPAPALPRRQAKRRPKQPLPKPDEYLKENEPEGVEEYMPQFTAPEQHFHTQQEVPTTPITPVEKEAAGEAHLQNHTDKAKALFVAISKQHASNVRKIVANFDNVGSALFTTNWKLRDAPFRNGWNPLHCAAFLGSRDVVEALLAGGCTTDDRTHQGQTALHIAAWQGHAEVVEALIRVDADVNVRTSGTLFRAQTPLHVASLKGHTAVIRVLLVAGAQVQAENSNPSGPRSALQLAVRNGHSEAVDLLLSSGANPCVHENGYLALHVAAHRGHDEVVQVLIDGKAAVDEAALPVKHLVSPLYRACLKGNVGAVQVLMRANSDPNFMTNWGNSPADIACINGHATVLPLLVNAAYNLKTVQRICAAGNILVLEGILDRIRRLITNCEPNSSHPLFIAVSQGHHEIVSLLYSMELVSSDISVPESMRSPLHYAAAGGFAEVCRILVANNVPVNVLDAAGNTPLHLASKGGHEAAAEVLLKEGSADPNIRNPQQQGSTAIHYAAASGSVELVRLLARFGSDVNAQKKSKQGGQTALEIAKINDKPLVITCLQSLGAKDDNPSKAPAPARKTPEGSKSVVTRTQAHVATAAPTSEHQTTKSAATHYVHRPWQTIRIFISSTFEDMRAERSHIVDVVIPQLRQLCAEYRIHIVEVDLRWGVTAEEAESGKTLGICLEEAMRCNVFVGIIGDRYGWVPSAKEIPEDVRGKYGWTNGASVTEMEARVAVLGTDVLQPARPAASFYFRSSDGFADKLSATERGRYIDTAHSQALERLRDTLRASGSTCVQYAPNYLSRGPYGVELELNDFGEKVLSTVWKQIQEICKDAMSASPADVDEVMLEHKFHDQYMYSRVKNFVGRREVLATLQSYIDDRDYDKTVVPLVVVGVPGAGKSAAMAALARMYVEQRRDVFTVIHFVGGSPNSTNVRQLLWRVCAELRRKFSPSEGDPPMDFQELKQLLPELLQSASNYGNVLIILDALNQLDESNAAHSLDWLPVTLPDGVRIVVSTLEGTCLTALRARKHKPRELFVGPLTKLEREQIVEKTLEAYHKKLTSEQMNMLLKDKEPASTNPLYLVVATEELRRFGVFERLDERIRELPADLALLFEQVFERLENEHGAQLVGRCLSYIECARSGIVEVDMLSLLRAKSADLSQAQWSRLLASLELLLKPISKSGDGRLDFFHRQLAKAVRRRYLRTGVQEKQAHSELGHFYHQMADKSDDFSFPPSTSDTYQRGVSEFLYHKIKGQEWTEVACFLCNLRFIEAKCWVGLTYDLLDDYLLADSAATAANSAGSLTNVSPFRDFVFGNVHVFRSHPHLVFQQAINLADVSPVNRAAFRLRTHPTISNKPCFTWVNKPLKPEACKMTLVGHSGALLCAAQAPDGTVLVSGDADGSVKAWEPVTGRTLFTWTNGANNSSQPSGGNTVIDSLEGRTRSDRVQKRTQEEASGALHGRSSKDEFKINGLDISTGGWVVSVAQTGALRLYSVLTGKEMDCTEGDNWKSIPGMLQGTPLTAVRFSPDGGLIAAGSDAGHLQLFAFSRTIESSPLRHLTTIPACGPVTDLAFSPLNTELAVVSSSKEIVRFAIVNRRDLRQVGKRENAHARGINSVQYSPDGKKLLTASQDRTIALWDIASMQQLPGIPSAHSDNVRRASFSSDGKRIVTCGWDKQIFLWDCAWTGSSKVTVTVAARLESAHSHWVNDCFFSPAGDRVISASEDKALKVFTVANIPLATNSQTSEEEGHRKLLLGLSISPCGEKIATASWDHTLKIWTMATTGVQKTWRVARTITFDKRANNCGWDSIGQNVVVACSDKTVSVWEAETGELVLKCKGHTDGVFCCCYSPDATMLASGGQDGQLIVWNAETGEIQASLTGHTDWVNCCAFSSESDRVVSGSRDLTIKVWDPFRGYLLATLSGHTEEIYGIGFNSTDQFIVSASRDKTLKVWEDSNCVRTLIGHENEIDNLAFLSDDIVVSACADCTLRVWNIRTGKEIWAFFCVGQVMSVAVQFDPTRHMILAGDSMGRLYHLSLNMNVYNQ